MYQDMALVACNHMTKDEFQKRMAEREPALVFAITSSYREVELAHHASHRDAAPSMAPAHLDCSLVPFCGGTWLAMSLRYCCLDARGRPSEAKAYNVRLQEADPSTTEALQTPPWGIATSRALASARGQVAALVSELPPRGVRVLAVRLGQGLLPLLSDEAFVGAMRSAACHVRPSRAFELTLSRMAQPAPPAAAAAAAAGTGGGAAAAAPAAALAIAAAAAQQQQQDASQPRVAADVRQWVQPWK